MSACGCDRDACGPMEVNLGYEAKFFAGRDRVLSFEVLARGESPSNANAVMADASGWAIKWAMRRAARTSPHRSGSLTEDVSLTTTGGSITVVGTFNADRALNLQRVRVRLMPADTSALLGGPYTHALTRTDTGYKTDLAFGLIDLLRSASS